MIFKKNIDRIVKLAAPPQPQRKKFITLLLNEAFFLGIAPWLLLWPAQLFLTTVAPGIRINLPAYLTNSLAVFFIITGSALSLWSVAIQWSRGRGTPSLKLPTRKLLISGPYRWTRNPIQLGAGLYVFGLGIWYDGILTGGLAALVGLAIGILYIKLIEEHELELRFGNSYNEYKQKTPLLFPGRKSGSRSNN